MRWTHFRKNLAGLNAPILCKVCAFLSAFLCAHFSVCLFPHVCGCVSVLRGCMCAFASFGCWVFCFCYTSSQGGKASLYNFKLYSQTHTHVHAHAFVIEVFFGEPWTWMNLNAFSLEWTLGRGWSIRDGIHFFPFEDWPLEDRRSERSFFPVDFAFWDWLCPVMRRHFSSSRSQLASSFPWRHFTSSTKSMILMAMAICQGQSWLNLWRMRFFCSKSASNAQRASLVLK